MERQFRPILPDPPRHASAHGYYKDKPAKHHKGKSGVIYERDYGIESGRCNRDEIGAVIGGVTGAVGMVVGGVLGAVVGHTIGDRMDERDHACMGHALELGRAGVPVQWRHDGRDYHFTPRDDARDGCGTATLVVDGRKPHDVLACPTGRGEWRFRRT